MKPLPQPGILVLIELPLGVVRSKCGARAPEDMLLTLRPSVQRAQQRAVANQAVRGFLVVGSRQDISEAGTITEILKHDQAGGWITRIDMWTGNV